MVVKYGFLSALGIALALAALFWIEPETAEGKGTLIVIIVGLVNGIGGLLWKKK